MCEFLTPGHFYPGLHPCTSSPDPFATWFVEGFSVSKRRLACLVFSVGEMGGPGGARHKGETEIMGGSLTSLEASLPFAAKWV